MEAIVDTGYETTCDKRDDACVVELWPLHQWILMHSLQRPSPYLVAQPADVRRVIRNHVVSGRNSQTNDCTGEET